MELLKRKAQIALEDLLTKGLRATEKAVGQAFDFADAELLPAERLNELVDLCRRV